MGEWLGLTDLNAADALVLILALPYLFIVTGRLVPRRQYDTIVELYNRSELARERALMALARVADVVEAGTEVVDAALSPPPDREERAP